MVGEHGRIACLRRGPCHSETDKLESCFGEFTPAARSAALRWFEKSKWLMVAMLAVVENSRLPAAISANQMQTTVVDKPERRPLRPTRDGLADHASELKFSTGMDNIDVGGGT